MQFARMKNGDLSLPILALKPKLEEICCHAGLRGEETDIDKGVRGEDLGVDLETARVRRARRRAAAAEGRERMEDLGQGGNGLGERVCEDQEEVRIRMRTMRDFTTPTAGSVYPGFGPTIVNHHFEIKPAIHNMMHNNTRFSGLTSEDPQLHLAEFSEVCGTFLYAGIIDDVVKLRLFPFSLRDKAKIWLHTIAPGTATTWEALYSKFLAKFHLVDKIVNARREIATFRQLDRETLSEA
ncbi:hypothetical protein KSP39_PZI005749 [Platanthera zijinensis]|uniref:Retrotransposon gag domain-containing protein n=1 Tax=Platanthera zijinensis TaxID=2320716 RepID=A0AAP0GAS1_9ASPA